MNKPIIGITSSYEQDEKKEYAFINHSYLDAIRRFGGIPLVLPAESTDEDLERLILCCDGIILSGGDDIDPILYGEESINDTLKLISIRDSTEIKVCDLAMQRNLPILGICHGVQLLNVYFGGTLIQDIPTQVSQSTIEHRMDEPYHRTFHDVKLDTNSLFSKL